MPYNKKIYPQCVVAFGIFRNAN